MNRLNIDALLNYQAAPSSINPIIDQIVARTHATFKHADLVRAVRAARAAGLTVAATQITPDGTIQLFHTDSKPSPASDYDRLEAEL